MYWGISDLKPSIDQGKSSINFLAQSVQPFYRSENKAWGTTSLNSTMVLKWFVLNILCTQTFFVCPQKFQHIHSAFQNSATIKLNQAKRISCQSSFKIAEEFVVHWCNYISLWWNIDDRHRNPTINNRDHLDR